MKSPGQGAQSSRQWYRVPLSPGGGRGGKCSLGSSSSSVIASQYSTLLFFWASIAYHRLARVTGVGVGLEVALGELEVVAGDDGVEGVGTAGKDFAGVAAVVLVLSFERVKCYVVFTSGREWSPC